MNVAGKWWQEFIRVETDKFLLLALIVAFMHWHDPDDLHLALGALVMAIQNARYQARPGAAPRS